MRLISLFRWEHWVVLVFALALIWPMVSSLAGHTRKGDLRAAVMGMTIVALVLTLMATLQR